MPPMPATDPRIDAYLATVAPFARPILEHLRAAVHAAVPEVEETIKWSRPHFLLDGRILCGMSAFKAHCAFGFWANREAAQAASGAAEQAAMGQFGRITSVADLPPARQLKALIQGAAREMRAPPPADAPPKAPRQARPPLPVPDDLRAALAASPAAQGVFDGFPSGQQREYIEWITEAKQAATRQKRLAQAVEWIAEGKRRNWKYENC